MAAHDVRQFSDSDPIGRDIEVSGKDLGFYGRTFHYVPVSLRGNRIYFGCTSISEEAWELLVKKVQRLLGDRSIL